MSTSLDITRKSVGEASSSMNTAASREFTPRSRGSGAAEAAISGSLVVPYVHSDYQKWERKKTHSSAIHTTSLSQRSSLSKHHHCCSDAGSAADREPPGKVMEWCSRVPVTLPRLPQQRRRTTRKREPPAITLLKIQIEGRKNSIQEYKKQKDHLTASNLSMIETIQNTDTSTHNIVTRSLDRYRKFKGVIVSVRDRSNREVSQARKELAAFKDQMKTKEDELEQKVKHVKRHLRAQEDILQVLLHYKEREYPVKQARIEELQEQLALLEDEHQDAITKVEENAEMERTKYEERMEYNKHRIESQAAQSAALRMTRSVVEKGVHNKIMIKEIEKQKTQLVELKSSIDYLHSQIQKLTYKLNQMNSIISPLTAMGRCDPDTEFVLDIPLQTELQF